VYFNRLNSIYPPSTRWHRSPIQPVRNAVEGEKDKLVGKIQERYGVAKEEAERQVDEHNWS